MMHLQTSLVARKPFLLGALGLLYSAILLAALQAGLAEPVLAVGRAVLADPRHVPDVAAVGTLFHSPIITVLAWVHLLMLDFYMSRWAAASRASVCRGQVLGGGQ